MNSSKRHSLFWIPSLYFVEGLPYIIVTVVSLIMYKRLGLSDTESAAYSGWLSLPWVIKPLWSPIVEIFKTKRWWILAMQALMGIAFALIAFTIPTHYYVQTSLALFFLIAFSSATHDIAADGFYMTALNEHDQAQYVGIRSTFYRLATIFTEGLLLMYIGSWEVITKTVTVAWSIGLGTIAGLFILMTVYHLCTLPKTEHNAHEEQHHLSIKEAAKEFGTTFLTFFQKPMIFTALTFMLLYRLPEALLTKIFPLFLSAKIENGGLALTTQQFWFRLWHRWSYRSDTGRNFRRNGRCKRWLPALEMAYGYSHFSPQRPLLFPCLLSAEQFCVGERGYCHRTIRLWIWFYPLYAIFALLCAGRI